jgi:hypothetical protein
MEEQLCSNCGHGLDRHGDRAIAACATGVNSSSPREWGRIKCPCPGWIPADGHVEPIPTFLPRPEVMPQFDEPPPERPQTSTPLSWMRNRYRGASA